MTKLILAQDEVRTRFLLPQDEAHPTHQDETRTTPKTSQDKPRIAGPEGHDHPGHPHKKAKLILGEPGKPHSAPNLGARRGRRVSRATA